MYVSLEWSIHDIFLRIYTLGAAGFCAVIVDSHVRPEGIITSFYDVSTIRDIGEDYLDELVRKNMLVLAEKNYLCSRQQYCQMHDIMREVCLSKAKKTNVHLSYQISYTSTSKRECSKICASDKNNKTGSVRHNRIIKFCKIKIRIMNKASI